MRQKLLGAVMCGAMACGAGAMCLGLAMAAVEAEAAESLSSRIERLESDVNSLQRKVYRGENVASAAARGGQQSLDANDYLALKTAETEKQIGVLTGEVETLAHRLEGLTDRLDKINADNNQRFNELQSKIEELGQVKKAEETARAEEIASKAEEEAKEKEKALTPKEEYAAAYALMNKKEFVSAGKAFAAFIEKYPDEALAGNAQYWLGETFYARKKYDEAAVAFAEGYQKYPTNNKAPDNFLKLGLTMQALGKNTEACTVFAGYAKEFPAATDNFKKRAKKEAEKLKCK